MRRLVPTAGALLLGLWACDDSGLPRDYRDVAVPETRLSSAEARDNGRALFLEHCAICHGERAEGGRGGDLKASKVREEFYETHGSRNFPPEIVTREIVDDIGAWLQTVRPNSERDDDD